LGGPYRFDWRCSLRVEIWGTNNMRDVDFRTVFLSDRAGYGLATANILYHLPERPKLLQTFIWQFYDVAPEYPRLEKFLDFWIAEIDGIIHSVEVAHRRLATAAEIRHARFHGQIH
jgi:uncharacterized protein Usg